MAYTAVSWLTVTNTGPYSCTLFLLSLGPYSLHFDLYPFAFSSNWSNHGFILNPSFCISPISFQFHEINSLPQLIPCFLFSSDEFSYIHRFYLIPVPDTKKWPGLLQIPAPEFRAVRTDSLPFSDLPDESCRKTVSCLVSILLTAKKSVSCTKFGRVYVADYGCLESI